METETEFGRISTKMFRRFQEFFWDKKGPNFFYLTPIQQIFVVTALTPTFTGFDQHYKASAIHFLLIISIDDYHGQNQNFL